MAKIRSNRALLYDSRANKYGVIELEITSWKYSPIEGVYETVVVDYLITEDGGNDIRTIIARTPRNYTVSDIDNLFTSLGMPININDSFTSKLNDLIAQALLSITVNDVEPIYQSVGADWDIV